jgi:hypothetical protein
MEGILASVSHFVEVNKITGGWQNNWINTDGPSPCSSLAIKLSLCILTLINPIIGQSFALQSIKLS